MSGYKPMMLPTGNPKCKECDEEIQPGNKFCMGCGAAVPLASAAPPEIVGPRCGQCKKPLDGDKVAIVGHVPLHPDCVFCAQCGTTITSTQFTRKVDGSKNCEKCVAYNKSEADAGRNSSYNASEKIEVFQVVDAPDAPCGVCKGRTDRSPCVYFEGKYVHASCFKCAACKLPITLDTVATTLLVLYSSPYHAKCKLPLAANEDAGPKNITVGAIKCSKCGAESSGSKFCMECGASLATNKTSPTAAAAATTKTAPAPSRPAPAAPTPSNAHLTTPAKGKGGRECPAGCGAMLGADDEFCLECGARKSPLPAPEYTPEAPKKSEPKIAKALTSKAVNLPRKDGRCKRCALPLELGEKVCGTCHAKQ